MQAVPCSATKNRSASSKPHIPGCAMAAHSPTQLSRPSCREMRICSLSAGALLSGRRRRETAPDLTMLQLHWLAGTSFMTGLVEQLNFQGTFDAGSCSQHSSMEGWCWLAWQENQKKTRSLLSAPLTSDGPAKQRLRTCNRCLKDCSWPAGAVLSGRRR